MKVYNFGGKDKHLDPPDIPDVDSDNELLSTCCTANALYGIDEDRQGICSWCKEHATFTNGEED